MGEFNTFLVMLFNTVGEYCLNLKKRIDRYNYSQTTEKILR